MRLASSLLLVSLAVPATAHAQAATDTLSLAGRNVIALGIGLTGARDATASGGSASTHTTGQVASIAFTHFERRQLAIEISAAVLDADTKASPGYAYNSAVLPVLFGLSYSPRELALTTSVRPFVSAAVGPYFHSVNIASATGVTSSTTESAAGARFGAGVNWYVARHFMLQLEGDYHAVGSFEHPDALTQKPSGFGLSFGFGFMWGR